MFRARFALLVFLAASSQAMADGPPPLVFHPLRNIAAANQHAASFTESGGIPVNNADWATLVMVGFPGLLTPDGHQQFCTAAFVGPSVIVTAAHCVFDEKKQAPSAALLAIEGWGTPIPVTCLVDSRYATDKSRDFSLCHIAIEQGALDLLGISRFESLETQQTYAPGSPVVLTGYGCTNLRIADSAWDWDPADGVLRVGDSKLSTIPGGNGQGRNLYTVVSHGAAPALCPGDSGGPLIVGVTASHPLPYRRIIAVNHEVDTWDRVQGTDFSSSMTGVDTADFSDFLTNTYRKAHPEDRICGLPDMPAGQDQCR